MITKVTGEQPFQVLSDNFTISPSAEGYTLQVSADGVNFSDLFAVGANVTRMVTDVASGSYYKASGNQSELSVNWRNSCGGGGGGGSYTLPKASATQLGGIKVGQNLSIDSNGVLSAQGGGSSEYNYLQIIDGDGHTNVYLGSGSIEEKFDDNHIPTIHLVFGGASVATEVLRVNEDGWTELIIRANFTMNGTRYFIQYRFYENQYSEGMMIEPNKFVKDDLTHFVKLTQTEYDALDGKDDNTLYIING